MTKQEIKTAFLNHERVFYSRGGFGVYSGYIANVTFSMSGRVACVIFRDDLGVSDKGYEIPDKYLDRLFTKDDMSKIFTSAGFDKDVKEDEKQQTTSN